MKILLDECIPRKLKYNLLDHECHTVPEAGFAAKKNGALLGLAESAGFFVIFVTIDKRQGEIHRHRRWRAGVLILSFTDLQVE
jgi:hypothetical protein